MTDTPEILSLPPNPKSITLISTTDFEYLQATHDDLWLNPELSCITCDKTSQFRTLQNDQEVTIRCNCLEQWQLYLRMMNAGIGLAYQRLGWKDLKGVDPSVLPHIGEYLQSADSYAAFGRALTLWSSSYGTGKTLLMTLIMRDLMLNGFEVLFIQFNQLINLYSAGWRDTEARKRFERRIVNTPVLGIDDMGKENAGRGVDMINAMVDEVLRSRVENARPTFLTTNLSPEEMQERYYSSMIELFTGVNDFVEVRGESYRQKFADEQKLYIKNGWRRPVTLG